MEGLLFLAHRIPFPPNKGDKIRSYHLLRHLAERHAVHLGAFVDDPDDWQYREALTPYCASVKLLPLHPGRARLASLAGLVTGEALTLPYYRNSELTRWAQALADRGVVTRGLAFSSAMAQFMPRNLARRVIDMVDVDSDKWTQYAPTLRWPLSWVYAREGRKLAAWEAQVAQDFDATLLVSDEEAALLQRRVPQARAKIGAFENGVDAEYFSPARDYPDPYPAGALGVVFTGAMDYWPNVDAVCWFAQNVLPRLRQRWPQARLHIVGRSPTPAVQALAGEAVHVTGTVPDVRPYLQHAAVVVAPLRLARGVQNKVLEAMAMGLPVVLTPAAATGIGGMDQRHFAVAESDEELTSTAAALIAHPPRARKIGRDAREFAIDRLSWEAMLAPLDTMIARRPLVHPRAA